MTRSDAGGTMKIFATFRIVGDQLVPRQITEILKVPSTQPYAKGQNYSAGARSQNLTGTTGVWFLATDRLVVSNRLEEHLGAIIRPLFPSADNFQPLIRLRNLMEKRGLQAHVSCFWYGKAGAKRPVIPQVLTGFFALIPADVETDFETDEEPVGRRVA